MPLKCISVILSMVLLYKGVHIKDYLEYFHDEQVLDVM